MSDHKERPIPLAQHDVRPEDIAAVVDVLKSDRLSLGPKTKAFERALAEAVGVPHAVAVNSGTSALHLLIRAFEIGPGDEVVTTPFSFIASTNCILFERATPVFVDIDPETLCIDPSLVERAITPRTKAILAVDVFGHPAQLPALEKIAKAHGAAADRRLGGVSRLVARRPEVRLVRRCRRSSASTRTSRSRPARAAPSSPTTSGWPKSAAAWPIRAAGRRDGCITSASATTSASTRCRRRSGCRSSGGCRRSSRPGRASPMRTSRRSPTWRRSCSRRSPPESG